MSGWRRLGPRRCEQIGLRPKTIDSPAQDTQEDKAKHKKITLGKVLGQTENVKVTAIIDSAIEKLKVRSALTPYVLSALADTIGIK